jgi:hypothetical protein
MCGPLAAISPFGALMQAKPRLATALISPGAALLGLGPHKKVPAQNAPQTPAGNATAMG